MGIRALFVMVLLMVSGCYTPHIHTPHTITITFVRHAESTANAAHIVDTTVPGPVLTRKGQCQALKIAPKLVDKHPDAIFASQMIRTQETATPTALALNQSTITPLAGLNEIAASPADQGKPESGNFMDVPREWMAGYRARSAGGEDGNDFQARFTAALNTIYASGYTNPLVFAHSGTIQTGVEMNVLNPDPSLLSRKPLPNVGQVEISGSPGYWVLVDWSTDVPSC